MKNFLFNITGKQGSTAEISCIDSGRVLLLTCSSLAENWDFHLCMGVQNLQMRVN